MEQFEVDVKYVYRFTVTALDEEDALRQAEDMDPRDADDTRLDDIEVV